MGGTTRKRLQAEKTAWWENPGSVVLTPITTVLTGIFCTSWLDGALNPKVFSCFYLGGIRERRCVWAHICEGFSEGSKILTWPSTFPGSLSKSQRVQQIFKREGASLYEIRDTFTLTE